MSEMPVNILHIISPGSGNFGGIEAYLMNYYANMNHEKVHFDFAFCGSNTMKLHMYNETFVGSSFLEFKVLERTNNKLYNWKNLIRDIRELIKNNNYQIVEVHTASPMIQAVCGVALRANKKIIRIAHSHALQEPASSMIVSIASKLCVKIIQNSYDFFFACSRAAGEMYGSKVVQSGRFKKVNNAIDTSLFAYDENVRRIVRKEQGILDDCFVIGHVARLSEEKNQVFLVDVFNEIKKINNNSILWIVGEGPSREEIQEKIKNLGLTEAVILFGQRSDVPRLLQAMDTFVITSKLEGLCISAIESQAAGLPTFVSSGVPEECRITENFTQIPLAENASTWANRILDGSNVHRKDVRTEIESNGYDIRMTARDLEGFYFRE